MHWIILTVVGLALLYVLVTMLTDGRYFGKWLMHRIYDGIGPSIFKARSESRQWSELIEELQMRGDERVLDVGAAVGDLALTIATAPGFRGQVIGVDWSKSMMEAAGERALELGVAPRAHFQVVDVRQGLPFDESEFDVIFCLGLLETLPQAEKILAEFKRVLKPGGLLVLSLYRGLAILGPALSYDWYERRLSALKFRELRIAPCRRSHDVVIARL